jgi:Glycosyl transferase family 2
VRIFGLLVVRDEVDILRLCVLHHLTAGCERILVVDNGSSDGTGTVLRRLAKRTPLSWTVDPGPYRQDEFMTGLAHEAARAGADWILPLDADEFWTSETDLETALEARPQSGAAEVGRVDLVQRREQLTPQPHGVLTMTMRVAAPTEVTDDSIRRFLACELSVFEIRAAPKLALRAAPDLFVPRGAHHASGLPGPVVPAPDLTILHAPLRARSCLERKAEHGWRLEQAGAPEPQGWQVRHWTAQAAQGKLDAGWAASSHSRGALDVGARRVPLVPDDRLRRALVRWVRPPAKQVAARALRRSY